MKFFWLEFHKLRFRRLPRVLFLLTSTIFPVGIALVSQLSIRDNQVPEGLFADHLASAIIGYSQMYLFIPAWIIVLAGSEFSGLHVNRVVFARDRQFYFIAKIVFCLIVTLYFSILGLITHLLSVTLSPFDLDLGLVYYIKFVSQATIANLLFSLLLIVLVFLVRSSIVAFVVYFVWDFVESILYTFVEGVLDVPLWWTPLHLVRTIYAANGVQGVENYYSPFEGTLADFLVPVVFVTLVVTVAFRAFSRANLQALSD